MKQRVDNTLVEIYNKLLANESKIDNLGLYSGKSGFVLFYVYYGKYMKNQNIINKGITLFESILSNFSSIESTNFADGVSGVLWMLEHLKRIGVYDFDNSI